MCSDESRFELRYAGRRVQIWRKTTCQLRLQAVFEEKGGPEEEINPGNSLSKSVTAKTELKSSKLVSKQVKSVY